LHEPLNIAVDLYSGKKYLTSGMANSASISGMYIACDSSHFLEGNEIQVKYELNADDVPQKHNMLVSVTGLSENGILVTFCNYDNNTFCNVRDMILYKNTYYEKRIHN